MHDALVVRVLHGIADPGDEFEPRAVLELAFVAVAVQGHAGNVFHHQERPAGVGAAGVEQAGDARVVERAECLLLQTKACQDGCRSMPARITFTATRRRTGCSCSHRNTAAIPPEPSRCNTRHGPIRAGTSGSCSRPACHRESTCC